MRPLLAGLLMLCAAHGASVRILQTNAAGDELNVIDPLTNTIVLRVPNLEAAHGVAVSPAGRRAYLTVEGDSTVVSVDLKAGKELGRTKLSGHPNNIAVSKDGRYAFIAIVQAPGAVDVVDTGSMKIVKTIPMKGGVHNTYVTPDGKFVVAGSVVGKVMTVINAQTMEVAWELPFDLGVRPLAFEKNADGSTKRIFVQMSNFHGFAVVDFATHQEVTRITLPDTPKGGDAHSAAPAHGLGVAPDGKTLWSNSSIAGGVFAYSLPDLKNIGFVRTGNTPDWLTFTPDSKLIYIANAGSNSVSAVDMQMLKEVAKIPVGEVPKRNATAVVP